MKLQTIGTTPVCILPANDKRRRWYIQFIPSSIQANNTGLIFLGRGFQPVATVGHASQGEVLNAGAAIEEVKEFMDDSRPYKGNIFIVSDTAGQQCVVEEEADTE